jgi:hypothetical protein
VRLDVADAEHAQSAEDVSSRHVAEHIPILFGVIGQVANRDDRDQCRHRQALHFGLASRVAVAAPRQAGTGCASVAAGASINA